MSEIQLFYICSVVQNLISETRYKKIRNLKNNYCISIHKKIIEKYVAFLRVQCTFVLNINKNSILHRSNYHTTWQTEHK